MTIIYTPKKAQYDARLLLLPIVIVILGTILVLRLWYIQVVASPELSRQASMQNRASMSLLAPRGLIRDRNGVLLAGDQPELVITAIPKIIKSHPTELSTIAQLLDVDEEQLKSKLSRGNWLPKLPTPIFVNASMHQATKIAESSMDLPGVTVETQPMRYYPDPIDYSQILGNVWVPDTSDIKRLIGLNIIPAQYVGKFGIEWYYEKYLMGHPGTNLMEVDTKSHPLRQVSQDAPIPGDQLTLAIDSRLQKVATNDLKGHRGAVVALDPSNGEVLCLVSAPSLNLSLFDGGISAKNFSMLENDPSKPFENRAVNGFFPPGSTFKICTSIAMKRSGNFNLSDTVFCDGGFHMGRATIKCDEQHGSIAYVDALAKSCNTYFCTMGMRSGPNAIRRAALDAGLGAKTGIDLRTEYNGGVVPTEPYVRKVRKNGHWYGGDTANMSIGQGFVLASPIQMADVAEMVANRGIIYKPRIVHSIEAAGSSQVQIIKPEMDRQVDMPEDFWNAVLTGMQGTIDYGTGVSARIPGLVWGGKTGTAQHGKGRKNDAWFIGIAPLSDPKIVVAVIVEDSGYGASFAAPIARDVVRAYLASSAVVKVASSSSKVSASASKA